MCKNVFDQRQNIMCFAIYDLEEREALIFETLNEEGFEDHFWKQAKFLSTLKRVLIYSSEFFFG